MAFESIKNNLQRNAAVKLFLTMVAAVTATPATPYVFADEKKAKALVAAEPTLVAINETLKNDKGQVAIGATAAGMEAAKTITPPAAAAPKVAAAPLDLKIEAGIPVPDIKRGGRQGGDLYPFEKLEAGQSFFVPKSEAMPNPAKTLASTVSSATRRHRVEDGVNEQGEKKFKNTKVFTIRRVTEGEVEGARIWRTA